MGKEKPKKRSGGITHYTDKGEVTVTTSVTVEDQTRLRVIAAKRGLRSVAALLRELIQAELDKEGKG